MSSRAFGLQRIAAGLLMVLGIGHLTLLSVFEWDSMSRWISEGLWAAVPLILDAEPSRAVLDNEVVFWAGVGSFSVPLATLGAMLWWQAKRQVSAPGWLGWVLIVWFGVTTLLLVPSPSPLGIVAGALLVWASRIPVEEP